MTTTKTFNPPDWQIDEAVFHRAFQIISRIAQDRPCRVRKGFAGGLDAEDLRRVLVARGSWGRDEEPEPDEERKAADA